MPKYSSVWFFEDFAELEPDPRFGPGNLVNFEPDHWFSFRMVWFGFRRGLNLKPIFFNTKICITLQYYVTTTYTSKLLSESASEPPKKESRCLAVLHSIPFLGP